MATMRQSLVASITRRYPLYSGCGSLANRGIVQKLAGTGEATEWAQVHGGNWVAAPLEDYVGRAVFYSGELDRKITWVCSRLVRPGDTVLDVGANLGLVTFVLAAQVGPGGTVHAFEPNPRMQELIDLGIARNQLRNVRLHRVGLGRESGQLTLVVPTGHAGSASFVAAREPAACSRIQAPVRTLSGVMAEQRCVSVRLVKLDVEGFEPRCCVGRRNSLPRRPLTRFCSSCGLMPMSWSSIPQMRLLDEYGYGFFSIPKRLFRMRLEPFRLDRPPAAEIGHDFLAARLGRPYREIARLVRAA